MSFLVWPVILYLQQVYMYFRGSGKAAEMKRDAARGTMMAALWRGTCKCCPHGYTKKKNDFLSFRIPYTFCALLNTCMCFPKFWARIESNHIIKIEVLVVHTYNIVWDGFVLIHDLFHGILFIFVSTKWFIDSTELHVLLTWQIGSRYSAK